jgi:hypothetical protein
MTSPGEPTPLTRTQKRTILVGSIFVFTIGTALAGFGVWFARTQFLRLTTFPPVAATVDAVDVVSARDDQQGLNVDRPAVRYHFSVGGTSYTSDRVTPFSESRSGSWAHTVAARYHAGQAVTAYYNPANPSDAYLERQVRIMPFALIVFPLAFMGAWALALRSTARYERRDAMTSNAAARLANPG